MNWTPRDGDASNHHTLVDGIPPYMASPLQDWFRSQFAYRASGRVGLRYNIEKMQRYDLATRSNPLVEALRTIGPDRLFDSFNAEQALRIIDWTIYDNAGRLAGYGGPDQNKKLEDILSAGSSMWKVGQREGVAGLERRVPEGVQQAAEAAMSVPGAGALLSEAWHAAFGRSPDYEEAYEKAIKAVEEAGVHVVTPNNLKATLGTLVRDMKAQANWKLDLPTTDADVPIKMAEALWAGQESRHGGNGYRKPTQAEAEAAVMLAVPLVQWFTSGAIARR
ncbi:hypothetical protein ABS642_08970 [Microbacterium sp. A8/3-1]|uniref:DUF4145 domain-containing protein n=1 Tax=Microbacterium sp. A8/3-1 TaxID=3160749 RepID=A0AAU7W177_9MICO